MYNNFPKGTTMTSTIRRYWFGILMTALAILYFCLALVVDSNTATAQTFPNPPSSARAEDRGGAYQVRDQLNKKFLISWDPSCGMSSCTYTVRVTHNDGSYEHVVVFYNSDYTVNVKNNGRCIELPITRDYCAIGDVPMSDCPVVPMVICREGDDWVDVTAQNMGKTLQERLLNLERLTAMWEETSDTQRKAMIVETMALRELYYRRSLGPPTTPLMTNLLTSFGLEYYHKVETEVMAATDKRLLFRGLAN